MARAPTNLDQAVVRGFGDEWSRMDQSGLADDEGRALFEAYFQNFPWEALGPRAEGFDLGCGSGRWARLAAPRAGVLHCIDASAAALEVARRNLHGLGGCRFHLAGVDAMPLKPGSMDFGYCLGVLHHVPDTEQGLRACVETLKPGAPFLLYLYYAMENRPAWFRALWRMSEVVRRRVSRAPLPLRYALSQALAALVYWPLARAARIAERAGLEVGGWPLAYYRALSFYTMRTDALDRFGTSLEQRFTQGEIQAMMLRAGLVNIRFNPQPPFWTAIGERAGAPAPISR